MEKKDKKQFLLFLEKMESNGELKNDSSKHCGEFWRVFREVFDTAKGMNDSKLTQLLLDLESKNIEFFTSLKKDYFTYGILGYQAHIEAGEINEF